MELTGGIRFWLHYMMAFIVDSLELGLALSGTSIRSIGIQLSRPLDLEEYLTSRVIISAWSTPPYRCAPPAGAVCCICL